MSISVVFIHFVTFLLMVSSLRAEVSSLLLQQQLFPEIKIEVSKKNVFVGEAIFVQYVIYGTREMGEARVLNYPRLEGFRRRFFYDLPPAEEVADGRWKTVRYKVELFPSKPGPLLLDEMVLEWKNKIIRGATYSVVISPLPPFKEKGIFLGVVGAGHTFSANFANAKEHWNIGEEVLLMIKLKGLGALEFISLPTLFPLSWRIEKSRIVTTFDQQGIGEKVFNYSLYSEKMEKFEALTHIFYEFDPDKALYRQFKLTLPPISFRHSGNYKKSGKSEDVGQLENSKKLRLLPLRPQLNEVVPWERYIWVCQLILLFIWIIYRFGSSLYWEWWVMTKPARELASLIRSEKLNFHYLYHLFPRKEKMAFLNFDGHDGIVKEIRDSKFSPRTENYFVDLVDLCAKRDFSALYIEKKFPYNETALAEIKKRSFSQRIRNWNFLKLYDKFCACFFEKRERREEQKEKKSHKEKELK